jgi:hypothetical protein
LKFEKKIHWKALSVCLIISNDCAVGKIISVDLKKTQKIHRAQYGRIPEAVGNRSPTASGKMITPLGGCE